MAFGKKKTGQENTVEIFKEGQLVCSECGDLVSFDEQPPLSIAQCSVCGAGYNFVPLGIDRFWLFAPLGGGGMGSVYKALIEGDPGELAAVKVLPRDRKEDPELIASLQAEAVVLEQMGQHPCIVCGLGSGDADGEHFLAMQYIEGERLDKRIERLKKLPELEVLMTGLRLLQAETHVYNQGFLYRDMKPENVIIHEHGAFLFDYGICIRIEDAYADQGDVVSGSPIYWPPERVTGEVEMTCSEIYSLGMVIYHALKGEPYFQAKEIDTMARKHVRTARLQDQDEKMKKIRPDLAEVILKMIERDPVNRYQNFAEVEYELTRILTARLQEI